VLLSDKRIKEEFFKGNIAISPFEESQLGTNSYDVRIGCEYYCGSSSINDMRLGDMSLYWEPLQIALDSIPVAPGATILAHTIEEIETINGFTFQMHARSTIARSCLSVCRCAGLGDVGYKGRLTMEISNHTPKTTIWVPIHTRVAQICFMEVGETDKTYQGKYGKRDWVPEDMLPRMDLDFDFGWNQK
jgi:dCTP deaminase